MNARMNLQIAEIMDLVWYTLTFKPEIVSEIGYYLLFVLFQSNTHRNMHYKSSLMGKYKTSAIPECVKIVFKPFVGSV